ncbi:hypothetical protein [Cohnella kolymensis]|uniref:hypothetical protein n=1 Tax=Cohnella kolymensis TaxID=1590652 RepID=UPI002E1335CD
MRKVHINSAKPGDAMAKPIWTDNGNILIGVGVVLNDRYIERLKSLGIDSVYIEDRNTSGIIPEDVIRDGTRKKAVETVYQTMSELTAANEIKRKVVSSNMGKATIKY